MSLVAGTICGCAAWRSREPRVQNPVVEHYNQVAERIAYPSADSQPVAVPPNLGQTRPLVEPKPEERRPISLAEAVQLGLRNNALVRQDAQFLSRGNPLLVNPDAVPSIFDTEIQDNGVLFGSRGIHAALSDFDPRLTTSTQWGRDENVQNNRILSGGLPALGVLVDENAQYQSRLEQQLFTGGTFSVNHNWNYSSNNQSARQFPSAYTGVLGAEFRQPIWAGGGREFTSIAGPSSQRARGFSYVNQGVVIAKINTRISEIDFQENVQNLVREIGNLYWDLYQSWQEYEAEKSTATASRQLWDEVKAKFQAQIAGGADEAQAEDTYYEAVSRQDLTLSTFLQTEARLRRLLGLPVSDGLVLFPNDPPIEAEIVPDRAGCLFEAYVNRLELRRQKSNIQSLELQLTAARNLAHPRLDFVSGYQLNGFGDHLVANGTGEPFNSAYGSILRGRETSWNLGFEYSISLWQRAERAQVRQMEMRLVKARVTLATQEDEIAHELNAVLQSMQRWLRSARNNKQRHLAAKRRVEAASAEYHIAGRTGVDPVLRAEISQTQAQVAYHRSIAEYNKSLRELLYRTGRLLSEDGIELLRADGQPLMTPTPLPKPSDPGLQKTPANVATIKDSAFDGPAFDQAIPPSPVDPAIPPAPFDEVIPPIDEVIPPAPFHEALLPVPID
ncbi:MAG: TolC family protein [Planctomycetota bacterium]